MIPRFPKPAFSPGWVAAPSSPKPPTFEFDGLGWWQVAQRSRFCVLAGTIRFPVLNSVYKSASFLEWFFARLIISQVQNKSLVSLPLHWPASSLPWAVAFSTSFTAQAHILRLPLRVYLWHLQTHPCGWFWFQSYTAENLGLLSKFLQWHHSAWTPMAARKAG